MSDQLEAFQARADVAGILLDFDGTLSEIVDVPSAARPYPGVVDVLARLARRYRTVAIVSGRSAHELVDWLGPELDIWGVHGAERSRPGETEVTLSPAAARFSDTMTRVREEAQRALTSLGIGGTLVEDKGVMVVLHYRAAENAADAREVLQGLSGQLASAYALREAEGKMAFELRPPVAFSKGDVVHTLAQEGELQAILFAGDDTVDLPGFDALDSLASEGVLGLRVGVTSAEAPVELVERADLVVEGPRGMVELLQRLV